MDFLAWIFNSIGSFFSNGLIIALLASIFTSFLNDMRKSFISFNISLNNRSFITKEYIFIIEQNKFWIELISNGNIPFEIGINHISHIKLMNSTYSTILDDLIFKTLLMYEKNLSITIANLAMRKVKPKQNINSKAFADSSNLTLNSLNIILDIYKRALSKPKKSFINSLMGVSEIQPDSISRTQEKSEQPQSKSNPKQKL